MYFLLSYVGSILYIKCPFCHFSYITYTLYIKYTFSSLNQKGNKAAFETRRFVFRGIIKVSKEKSKLCSASVTICMQENLICYN